MHPLTSFLFTFQPILRTTTASDSPPTHHNIDTFQEQHYMISAHRLPLDNPEEVIAISDSQFGNLLTNDSSTAYLLHNNLHKNIYIKRGETTQGLLHLTNTNHTLKDALNTAYTVITNA